MAVAGHQGPVQQPAGLVGASSDPRRVLVAGASGYIGRVVVRALVEQGERVVALVRRNGDRADARGKDTSLHGAQVRVAEVTDPVSLARDGFRGDFFDAVVSCLASRSGAPRDAWRVDHQANVNLLRAAEDIGVGRFVLLSAICVQNPRLAFQHAKLAFESTLTASTIRSDIVRPTAFFKSLAGQVPRVKAGKPFMLFGPGDGPRCKPISERDLAWFMATCVKDDVAENRILPIGGPGPALSARERGELLFDMLGRTPRFRRVPLALFDLVGKPLDAASRIWPSLADKAEFARIGRFYATEPMLWRDPETGRYDESQTPSFGTDTLREFYARVLEQGLDGQELGEQALF